MIQVKLSEEIGLEKWDEFVHAHPYGRYCHLTGYASLLQKVYSLKPYLFAAMDGEEIVAVLPIYDGAGNHLNSIPFSQYGGPLVRVGNSRTEVCSKLFERVRYLPDKGVVIRGLLENTVMAGVGEEREQYDLAILHLPDDAQKLFDTAFRRSVKKAIRKGERSDVSVVEDHGEDLIRSFFYPRYLLAMKKFGTPTRWTFFWRWNPACPALGLFNAYVDEKPVASPWGLATRNVINILSIVSDPDYLEFRPNDMVHWEYIKWGVETGRKMFDFGVVRYAGQRQFKEKWGCTISPYRIAGIGSNVRLEVGSDGVGLLGELWKKIVPVSLTPVLGRHIRKRFGR